MQIRLPTPDKRWVDIEVLARDHEAITVDHQGNDGTVLNGPESAFRDIIDTIKEQREDHWDTMASKGTTNQQVDELEEKRKNLKRLRNRLRRVLDNPDDPWRES